MKRICIIFPLFLVFMIAGLFSAYAKDVAAVLNMDTRNVLLQPSEAGNLLRVELEQTNVFFVIDRYDTEEILEKNGLNLNCFSRNCLVTAGKALEVDVLISGSIERFGEKIVITLRQVDVAGDRITESEIYEYQNLQRELSRMIRISVQKFTGSDFDKRTDDALRYYDKPVESEQLLLSNNGPRMGLAYIFGDMGQRLSDPVENGGYDVMPLLTQFGYQHEHEYLSSGNFHALFEMVIMISGMEQQLFIPAVVLLNGFRSSRNGLEFGFGPRFGLSRRAEGYYVGNTWHLKNEWDDEEPNPNKIVERLDRRGELLINPGWIWAVGKTFRSGHLNIPVNIYFNTPAERGWQMGLSVGFNMKRPN